MAVVRLAYKLASGQANIIDVARGLSNTERRMVHQKQVFTILGGIIVDDQAGTLIKIATAPNNFYTRNAVTRGFLAWKSQRAKVLEADSSLKTSKYADFKVHLDETVFANHLMPVDAGSNQISDAGDWDYSDLEPDNGTRMDMMIVGKSHTATRYSLAKGWLETRPLPADDQPEMPDLNADGTADVTVDFIATLLQDSNESNRRITDIIDEGDNPPFVRTELMTTAQNYSGTSPNNLQLQFVHHASTNETHHVVPGFQALCGLIRADVTGGSDPILILDVETKGWNF